MQSRTSVAVMTRGAASVLARMSDVLGLLLQFPLAGRQTARPGVRRLTIVPYPYNLDYRVDREEVVILGIRHASRQPLS